MPGGFLSGLSLEQCRNLIEDALEKYRTKSRHDYGPSVESTAWLIGRTLYHEGYEPFVNVVEEDNALQGFLNSGSFAMDEILEIILIQAEAYLAASTG